MKRNKKLILISLSLFLLVLILLTSYGYLSTAIIGNSSSKKNVFKSNPLSISYNDNTNVITGDVSSSFTPGSTITKSFSITNPENDALTLSITLNEVTNTFTRTNDVTYTLSLNGDIIKSDVFPTERTTIVYNQSILSNETLNYVLTINYVNDPNENQIVDNGAEIGAKLVFDYGKGIDNILIYGNSVQNGIPTTVNPIEIESVGDLVTDSQDSNYGKYKITITVGANAINIFLNEPLRKIGNYSDYIDIKNKRVVRNVEVIDNTGTLSLENSLRGLSAPTEESISVPNLSIYPANTNVTVDTSVLPSDIKITTTTN